MSLVMEKKQTKHYITPTQLCVGLYVHLDLGWMDHPFTFSNFKIQNAEQVEKIKAIGLKQLRYDPLRSDTSPLVIDSKSEKSVDEQPADVAPEIIPDTPKQPEVKKARLIQLHQAIEENKAKFLEASKIAKHATDQFLAQPQAAIEEADHVVSDMVDVALTEGDVAIHAISQQNESDYQHNMNTMVLSLMLSKTLDLSHEDAHTLGIAALFHDIGKLKIQPSILNKATPLTSAETEILQAHTVIGAQLALDAGLSEQIAQIILSHHELMDGTGYPKQLAGENIDLLSRIVCLVNAYDNLCNPQDVNQAKTPYEALAYLFAHQRHQYDEVILKRMIKTLGIYPPGSMVQLSSGMYANVISGNVNHPLRPFVMLHEINKTNGEPTVIDLREEPTMNISICLRPNQLPPEVLAFFNPNKRMQFFLETALPELLADQPNTPQN